MALQFSPEHESILKEFRPWRLELPPPVLELNNKSPKYAVILIMAGDDSEIGGNVEGDLKEIALGVQGGDEVSVLVLADMAKPRRQTSYYEITGHAERHEIKKVESIDTGDPRPIAAFLTAALNSFSPETRIAIGLWGHGEGVIGDLDATENLIPDELRLLPLGTPFTEADFIRYGILNADPIKPLLFKSMLPDMETGNVLTNRELSSALAVAFSRCRRKEPVDMIFFDTCYNGAAEVYAEVRRYAHTFVASSLRLPSTGWDYKDFFHRTRQTLPQTPQAWAQLAISSCNYAYNQEFYQSPVHMVALNCQTEAFERLREIVETIQAFTPEHARDLIQQASTDLKAVGRNESLDLFHVVSSIRQATEDEKLHDQCQAFLKAYRETVVAISAPSNDGRFYTGLTVWFPRLGDTHQVHRYYEHLQFHRETQWLKLIDHLIHRAKQNPPAFLVYCFQGLKLLEEHPVNNLFIDTSIVRDATLLLKVSSNTWNSQYKEGRYSYKRSTNITFSSAQDYRALADTLTDIQRHQEFEPFQTAQQDAVTLDSEHAKKLGRALWKYKNIIMDEFPTQLSTYEALQELAGQATESRSVIVISRLQKPELALESTIRASNLFTQFTLELATMAPRGFKLPLDSLRYYQAPLDITALLENPRHPHLGTTQMLGIFGDSSLERPVHIHVVKYINTHQQEFYSLILRLGDPIPQKNSFFHFEWSEWGDCSKCSQPFQKSKQCPCSYPTATFVQGSALSAD